MDLQPRRLFPCSREHPSGTANPLKLHCYWLCSPVPTGAAREQSEKVNEINRLSGSPCSHPYGGVLSREQHTSRTVGAALGRSVMRIEDFEIGGQKYTCVGSSEYEIQPRWVTLYDLKTHCVDCGRAFKTQATKTRIRRREMSRRCEDCRSPGIPIERRKAAPKPPRAKAPSARKAQRRRAQARLAARRAPVAVARAPQQPAGKLPAVAAPPIEPAPTASAAAAFEADLDTYKAALGLLDG